jgi:formate hydrogenlyase subunit 6/NADH:ubiquinone oxidoreductase subunit I
MKRLVKDELLCIGCGACVDKCSSTFFKEKNDKKSRIKLEKFDDRNWNRLTICTQCGVCAEVCPTMALNKKDCVGCFMCVGFCPEGIMIQHDDYLEPFKCIACGLCVDVCPTGALKIQEF